MYLENFLDVLAYMNGDVFFTLTSFQRKILLRGQFIRYIKFVINMFEILHRYLQAYKTASKTFILFLSVQGLCKAG